MSILSRRKFLKQAGTAAVAVAAVALVGVATEVEEAVPQTRRFSMEPLEQRVNTNVAWGE